MLSTYRLTNQILEYVILIRSLWANVLIFGIGYFIVALNPF